MNDLSVNKLIEESAEPTWDFFSFEGGGSLGPSAGGGRLVDVANENTVRVCRIVAPL